MIRTPFACLIAAALALASSADGLQGQSCPTASGPAAEAGWNSYAGGDMAAARASFEQALELCDDDGYARTGLGYVALREGDSGSARVAFERVLRSDADAVDALVGLGIVEWRAGRLQEVAALMSRAVELDPSNDAALDYLSRLPEGIGEPPERAPLVRPDQTVVVARATGDQFEVSTEAGWEPFYVKGINLGAALPGRFASEFPDEETYREWVEQMADGGANTVRLYTIHPPRLYEVIAEWNQANPDRALWIIHGVWTALPEDDDYLDPAFETGFFEEMERVVDVIHGRADLTPKPGRAAGWYTADVSRWTVGYIIGREWEPYSSIGFQELYPDLHRWDGRFLQLRDGNAMEAWLTKAMDHMAAREMDRYNTQRPIAWTNWPTLDPMDHVTEPPAFEEVAIRRARGEFVEFVPQDYDNDAIGLHATRVQSTSVFEAGTFASFHAYPYYPDFMILQPSYADAASSFGPSRYFGYLQDLKSAHPGIPILISEYGVPASHGPAHLQPEGQHHGGLTEAEMAEIDHRLTVELAESGMAGGAIFAWIDEWFKHNWLSLRFEMPAERNRLWHNRLDAEQYYGMIAMESVPPVEGGSISERSTGWSEITPLMSSGGTVLRAAADPTFLWIRIEGAARTEGERMLVGFDTVGPEAGDRRWPGGVGVLLPVGVEFALVEDDDGVRILVDPPMNPFRLAPEGQEGLFELGDEPDFVNPPPGVFRARLGQRFNLPWISEPNADGRYDSLRVIPNRRRVSRDTLEYRAVGYDRGVLPAGPLPDGLWERDGDVVEYRVPWMLLNFGDPSSRSILASPEAEAAGYGRTAEGQVRTPSGSVIPPDTLIGDLSVRQIESIGLVAALESGSTVRAVHPEGEAPRFTWDRWEVEDLQYRARPRPALEALRQAFDRVGYHLYGGTEDRSASPKLPPTGLPTPGPESGGPSAGPMEVVLPIAPGLLQVGLVSDTLEVDLARGDSAWRDGDLETAESSYRAVLEADSMQTVALQRLALIHAWRSDYDTSLEYYDRLLAISPDNAEARIGRARVVAWSGDYDQAIEILDEYLAENPQDPAALEARATFLAWGSRYDDALSTYDELLAISPGQAQFRRQQAQVLSWAGRYGDSRQVYDSLLAVDPDDVDARLGLARVLTFSGDIAGAENEYRAVLEQDPDDVRGLQGLGRAQSWDGRLKDGEATFRRAVEVDPEDVASWVGLAQNLRWQGRNAAALEVLDRAEEIDASDNDLREQKRWVDVALAPQAGVTFVAEDDSDGNRMQSTSFVARWNPHPRLGLRADLYDRDLRQTGLQRYARGLNLSASWFFEPGWVIAAGVGGSRNDGVVRTDPTAWRASLSSPGRNPVRGSVGFSQTPLDATALLAQNGVRVRALDLNGSWALTTRWRADGGVGIATYEGQAANDRTSWNLALERRLGTVWTVGASGRSFGFDQDLNEGYFDPDDYRLFELLGRWLHEPGAWSFRLEGAPGYQKVRTTGDWTGAWRVSARLGYRLRPGREIALSGGYSTAGLQSFASSSGEYSYRALILSANWVF